MSCFESGTVYCQFPGGNVTSELILCSSQSPSKDQFTCHYIGGKAFFRSHHQYYNLLTFYNRKFLIVHVVLIKVTLRGEHAYLNEACSVNKLMSFLSYFNIGGKPTFRLKSTQLWLSLVPGYNCQNSISKCSVLREMVRARLDKNHRL